MTEFRVIDAGPETSRYRIVQIEGECGLADIERLDKALAEAAEDRNLVVVGMEWCEFIDSMAIAALIRARERLAEDGRTLVLAGPTGQVRRVLEISGLNLDGLVFETVEQALGEG